MTIGAEKKVKDVECVWCQIDRRIGTRYFNENSGSRLTQGEKDAMQKFSNKGARHHVIPQSALKKITTYISTLPSLRNIPQINQYYEAFYRCLEGPEANIPALTLNNLCASIIWNPSNLIFGPDNDRLDDAADKEELLLRALRRGELNQLDDATEGIDPIAMERLNSSCQALVNAANTLNLFVETPNKQLLIAFLKKWKAVLKAGGFLVGAWSRLCTEDNYAIDVEATSGRAVNLVQLQKERKNLTNQLRLLEKQKASGEPIEQDKLASTMKELARRSPKLIAAPVQALQPVIDSIRQRLADLPQEIQLAQKEREKIQSLQPINEEIRRKLKTKPLASKYFLRGLQVGGYTEADTQQCCGRLVRRFKKLGRGSLTGGAMEGMAFTGAGG